MNRIHIQFHIRKCNQLSSYAKSRSNLGLHNHSTLMESTPKSAVIKTAHTAISLRETVMQMFTLKYNMNK